jgi:hypothetical protein
VVKDPKNPVRSFLQALSGATGIMPPGSAVWRTTHPKLTVFQPEDSESSADSHLSEGEFQTEETRTAKKIRRKEKYNADTARMFPKQVSSPRCC